MSLRRGHRCYGSSEGRASSLSAARPSVVRSSGGTFRFCRSRSRRRDPRSAYRHLFAVSCKRIACREGQWLTSGSGAAKSGCEICARGRRRPLPACLAELLSDERAVTVVAFTERALAFFARHGIEAKRLMTDNAWCYTHSRAFRDLLSKHAIKHLTIEPYRPRTNGKVERSTKRWRANGPMASATAAQNTARPLCHTGYSTTTRAGRTARSELGHRSAAFGTCVGRTPSQPLEESA